MYFSPKCSVIIRLLKEYFFPFSYVEPFGYNNLPNDGTIKFLAKFEAISTSPQKKGDKVKNPITGY